VRVTLQELVDARPRNYGIQESYPKAPVAITISFNYLWEVNCGTGLAT
jgi:hypothetical protein